MRASSVCRLNGFSRKSNAPALMACTAMGMSAQPEIMMIDISSPRVGQHLLKPQAADARHAHVQHHALGRRRRRVVAVEKRLGRKIGVGVESRAANHQAQGFADLRIVVHDIHGWGCGGHVVALFRLVVFDRLTTGAERNGMRPARVAECPVDRLDDLFRVERLLDDGFHALAPSSSLGNDFRTAGDDDRSSPAGKRRESAGTLRRRADRCEASSRR